MFSLVSRDRVIYIEDNDYLFCSNVYRPVENIYIIQKHVKELMKLINTISIINWKNSYVFLKPITEFMLCHVTDAFIVYVWIACTSLRLINAIKMKLMTLVHGISYKRKEITRKYFYLLDERLNFWIIQQDIQPSCFILIISQVPFSPGTYGLTGRLEYFKYFIREVIIELHLIPLFLF